MSDPPPAGGRTRFEPDALVFDCDGVLVDSDDAVVGAWSAWAVAYGLDPAAVVEVCHGQPARSTVAAFLAPDDVAAGIAVIDQLELELARDVRGLPGARDLLLSLPAGRWGIVTSGIRVLATTRLLASGIELPDVLVTADDVAHGKPHPEGYTAALERLAADARRSVVFEDAPTGIAAARAAGVGVVIGVGPRAVDADVDAIVGDLRDVTWDADGLVIRGSMARRGLAG
jgi:sugar-phosphatase